MQKIFLVMLTLSSLVTSAFVPDANATSSVSCETKEGKPLVGVIFSHVEEDSNASMMDANLAGDSTQVETEVRVDEKPEYVGMEILFEKNLSFPPVVSKMDLGLSSPCMQSGLNAHNFKGESEFESNPFDLCVNANGPKSMSIAFDSGAILLNNIRVSDPMREQIAFEMAKIMTQLRYYSKPWVKVDFQVLSRRFRIHFDPRETNLNKNLFAYTRMLYLNGVISEQIVQVIPGIRCQM